jgi:hypothetical protein
VIGRRISILMLCVGPLACGGGATPTTGTVDDRLGPVDLTQAPATLAMTCDSGASPSFAMPCLIGLDLVGPNAGSDPNAAGIHATECRLAQPDQPLAWSFLFPLADARANPSKVLEAPTGLPTVSGGAEAIMLQGESATMSSLTGDLTFTRVDPAARAFIGAFKGTVVWTGASGAQTTCQIDGPFWGAPGNFL